MFKLTPILVVLSSCVALAFLSGEVQGGQQVDLSSGWKFQLGDDPAFAQPDFDDSRWNPIDVDRTWTKQGYDQERGFAWYRIRVLIPSSLPQSAALKDSLIFNLGRIDDFDQVYLNGSLIGENLRNVEPGSEPGDAYKDLDYSFWDRQRRYCLPADHPLIKWDQENLIAVRVFDWGAPGGIYAGEMSVRMPRFGDYTVLDIDHGEFADQGTELGKTITVGNGSAAYTVRARLRVEVWDNMAGTAEFSREWSLDLLPGQDRAEKFVFTRPAGSTRIGYELIFEDSDEVMVRVEGVPYVLTPLAGDEPRINGALVYGERPGRPFLYRIAATGRKPLEYRAAGLPAGLVLHGETGIITGSVSAAGTYQVTLTAANDLGSDAKELEIVIGDKLALTPPMGWNSWNCWGLSVTQERIGAAARAFVEQGLADHGWTYINIDDGWEIFGEAEEPKRAPDGEILTNEKFPDMKQLGDDIHALGLKFGIYSSPGPLTCGGYTASYQHEQQDAETFAAWGIDYLKYDLCTFRQFMTDQDSPAELRPPYELMRDALLGLDRDIVYSLCEYGNGKVWEWGEQVGGNLWRTTGDIWDDWDRMYRIGFGQVDAAGFAGPGHWNDPDMLVLGWVGWGPYLHRTRLTPDEQYTHVSLWALLSVPLLLGNDLTRLDDFTLNLITNDEVIAIDQDRLGRQATPAVRADGVEVWLKDLTDGGLAVGIFNTGGETVTYPLDLAKLGLKGKVMLRDVWRQTNLGEHAGRFTAKVPPHGVVLLRTGT